MKYINADGLKDKIFELAEDDYRAPLDEYIDGLRQRTEGILDIIDETPAADVVEVVRCKDCSHYIEPYCARFITAMIPVNENDFCSKVKRRESDG